MPHHVAISGAGVIGLTCAYLLAEAGYKVIIVARHFYGDSSTDWASPW
jgi:D-amino-acid oxidase